MQRFHQQEKTKMLGADLYFTWYFKNGTDCQTMGTPKPQNYFNKSSPKPTSNNCSSTAHSTLTRWNVTLKSSLSLYVSIKPVICRKCFSRKHVKFQTKLNQLVKSGLATWSNPEMIGVIPLLEFNGCAVCVVADESSSWWRLETRLTNMFVELDRETPRFGVKIKNIGKPPASHSPSKSIIQTLKTNLWQINEPTSNMTINVGHLLNQIYNNWKSSQVPTHQGTK